MRAAPEETAKAPRVIARKSWRNDMTSALVTVLKVAD